MHNCKCDICGCYLDQNECKKCDQCQKTTKFLINKFKKIHEVMNISNDIHCEVMLEVE